MKFSFYNSGLLGEEWFKIQFNSMRQTFHTSAIETMLHWLGTKGKSEFKFHWLRYHVVIVMFDLFDVLMQENICSLLYNNLNLLVQHNTSLT